MEKENKLSKKDVAFLDVMNAVENYVNTPQKQWTIILSAKTLKSFENAIKKCLKNNDTSNRK